MTNRLFQFVSALCFVLVSHPSYAGQLSLYVFEKGHPAEDIAITLDGTGIGQTESDGRLIAEIGAGRHNVVLERDGERLASFEFKNAANQSADASVTLSPEAEPVVSINVYNGKVRQAQGMLRGRIVSRTTGAPLAGATVLADGLKASTVSDAVGHFELALPRGRHEIVISHTGYTTRRLHDVAIVGAVVQETMVRMSEITDLVPRLPPMEELTVVGTYVADTGSVEAVITDQREAMGVSDVLGIDQILRAGDSTAAAALKRVTGLTIEEDKFVVIRGQPERYTLTLWNGSPLPSPDPIRRIVPLDMFPTGSLSKIDVEKSYDASRPGSFGGGLIGLGTVGVPDMNSMSFSVSFGGNTETTGNTGLDYDGGDDDYLGYDDGTRDLPAGLADAESPAEIRDAARNFNNTWNISEKDIGPDASLGFDLNRAFAGLGAELGLRISLNWGQEFQTTERIERDFAVQNDGTLAIRNDQLEQRTDMNIDTSGLLAFTANWENHSLRSNTLLLRNSTQRSSISEGVRVVSDDLYIRDYLLEWNERELFAQQFIGEHNFNRFRVDWRAMLADSSRDSPDRRSYIYVRQSNGEYVFHNPSRAQRRFDKNDDDIDSFDIDLTVPFTPDNWKIDLVGGASQYSQDRESDIRRYSFRTIGGADLTAAPETLLNPANLGDTLQVTDQTQTNDNYLGDATIDGGYLKADIDWRDTVRVIVGVRQENADFQVRTFQAGGSQGGQLVEAGFDETEELPSLSITWRFRDDMQLRFSSGRSLSYPLLNEVSPARYYDPESNEEFLGNPNLKPAIIDALDGRWEWYPSDRELISFGLFSKDYTDAIEESFVGVGGSAYLRQIKNAPDATVTGTEVTARFELSRILPDSWAGSWSDLVYAQANATFIDSEVTLTGLGLETSVERPLQGQADEVYNLQVGYDGERHDIDVSYNRVGERLQIAGTEGQPDVYQQPIDQLDLNYSVQLFEGVKFKFNAGNLLDAEYELRQGGQVYRAYREGRDYSISLSWSIE